VSTPFLFRPTEHWGEDVVAAQILEWGGISSRLGILIALTLWVFFCSFCRMSPSYGETSVVRKTVESKIKFQTSSVVAMNLVIVHRPHGTRLDLDC
jgi:hypothetical protein